MTKIRLCVCLNGTRPITYSISMLFYCILLYLFFILLHRAHVIKTVQINVWIKNKQPSHTFVKYYKMENDEVLTNI